MNFDIRGSLGVQITSIIAAYAIAFEKKAKVENLIINSGSYRKEIEEMYPLVNDDHTYFNDVILFKEPPNICTTRYAGYGKTNAYTVENASLICKHLDAIRRSISIKPFLNSFDDVVHVRYLKDKRACRIDSFVDMADFVGRESPATVTFDSEESFMEFDKVAKQRGVEYMRSKYSVAQVKHEWLAIAHSNKCYGIPSAFSLSAALLNPNLEFHSLMQSECTYGDVIPQHDWDAFTVFVNKLDNIKWWKHD